MSALLFYFTSRDNKIAIAHIIVAIFIFISTLTSSLNIENSMNKPEPARAINVRSIFIEPRAWLYRHAAAYSVLKTDNIYFS